MKEAIKEVLIWIPGKPVPQGRYRTSSFLVNLRALLASRGKVKPIIQTTQYTPKETTEFKKKVKISYMKDYKTMLEGDAFWVDVYSMYALGASDVNKKTGKPTASGRRKLSGETMRTSKPDCDNLSKVIFDALNKIAFTDDSHIVSTRHYKFYHREEGTILHIRTLEVFPEAIIERANDLLERIRS